MTTVRSAVLSVGVAGLVLMSSGPTARAQILFDKIQPRKPDWSEIDPKGYRAEPYRTESAPTKPYTPMPHFHQRNILPDRIELGPINQHNIPRSHIRQNWLTFNPMIKEDIQPDRIRVHHLVHAMSPGYRTTATPLMPEPKWSFSLQMEGYARPTTRFDSSLKSPLPDYDAPNRQRVVTPPGSHPMMW